MHETKALSVTSLLVSRLCQWLHCLYFYAAYFHFNFSATHLPDMQNVAADAQLHSNMSLFHTCFLQVSQHMVLVSISDLIMHEQPGCHGSEASCCQPRPIHIKGIPFWTLTFSFLPTRGPSSLFSIRDHFVAYVFNDHLSVSSIWLSKCSAVLPD